MKWNFWNFRKLKKKITLSPWTKVKTRTAVERDEKNESKKLNCYKAKATILNQTLTQAAEAWQAFVTILRRPPCTSPALNFNPLRLILPSVRISLEVYVLILTKILLVNLAHPWQSKMLIATSILFKKFGSRLVKFS